VNRWLFLLLSVGLVASACFGDNAVARFRMEGASMSPTFEDGETLTIYGYKSGEDPALGDVILFRAPTSPNRDFIKRVIGVPGDTVEIEDGAVLVNGSELEEPYAVGVTNCLPGECRWELTDGFTGPERTHSITLGRVPGTTCEHECYFVLGDNRQNSSDSRQGWLVPRENIVGYVNPPD
jgi:signal peptidase I